MHFLSAFEYPICKYSIYVSTEIRNLPPNIFLHQASPKIASPTFFSHSAYCNVSPFLRIEAERSSLKRNLRGKYPANACQEPCLRAQSQQMSVQLTRFIKKQPASSKLRGGAHPSVSVRGTATIQTPSR